MLGQLPREETILVDICHQPKKPIELRQGVCIRYKNNIVENATILH